MQMMQNDLFDSIVSKTLPGQGIQYDDAVGYQAIFEKVEGKIYMERVIIWFSYHDRSLFPITCDLENTDDND